MARCCALRVATTSALAECTAWQVENHATATCGWSGKQRSYVSSRSSSSESIGAAGSSFIVELFSLRTTRIQLISRASGCR